MKQPILTFAFAICFVSCLFAADRAEQKPVFRRFSVDDGLSHSSVFAAIQDIDGVLWFGSGDGLNRYDGYSFDIFFNDISDPSSIGDNYISSLYIDSGNRLWVGTSVGLSLFDRQTKTFSNFRLAHRNMQVNAITELEPGRFLMLATNLGSVIFDTATQSYKFIDMLEGFQSSAFCHFNGNLLIGTVNGLYVYSLNYRTVSKVSTLPDNCDIADIVAVSDKECYVGTFGNGIFKIDGNFNIVSRLDTSTSAGDGLTSNNIRVLKYDNRGRLWVGTIDGLFMYDPPTGGFTAFVHDYNDPLSISHNSIRSILFDGQDGMWIGTFYGGVNYYNPTMNNFRSLQMAPGPNSLRDNIINAIVEDGKSGNLFIGTNDNGLEYYDPVHDRFRHIADANLPGGMRSNNIKAILPDGETGGLYIGTHAGGLSHVDTGTGKVRNYSLSSDIHINDSGYSLLENPDGTLWVGTLNGLLVFDREKRNVYEHPSSALRETLRSKMVFVLFRDSHDGVWIGTNRGLYQYSPTDGRLSLVKTGLNNEDDEDANLWVMAVSEDSGGNIWVGSRQGMFRYTGAGLPVRHYTAKDGLASNHVYGILEDDGHRLWISTNRGLSCFDPAEEVFRNYTKSDGFSSNQFSINSYCRVSNGRFYFGGINGITSFDPDRFSENSYSPKPHVYNVSILKNNQSKIEVARDSLGYATKARFSSKSHHFEIDFTVINPVSAGNNTYRYMLRGFDTDWQTTTNRRVNYSNLDPGNYTFELYAANNAGKWSKEPVRIEIKITPPWYQSLLAKIAYALAIFSAIWLGYRFFINRARMRMQLLIERMEKKKIQELSDEKIRFYINISHELRTPLSLILSPLQELMNSMEHTKFVKTRLNYIHRNSTKLLHIINQLLEYRKAELGVMSLKVSKTDVEKCVGNIFSMFEENALNRDLDYIFDSSISGKEYPCDCMLLEIITTNLLSNAMKFTPDAGTIRLSISEEAGRLFIRVWDNGMGIAPENLDRIFDRFYQEKDSHSGTGIGLSLVKKVVELHHGTITVDSEPGKFTEFTVSLPTLIEEYSPEELAAEQDKNAWSYYTSHDISLFLEKPADPDAVPATYGGDKQENNREHILIVDDNRDMLNYLSENFSSRYAVYTASNGNEAMDILKNNEIDLIITDLMMDGMSGLELCRQVKQNLKTCHIPVVILTAKESLEDQQKGIEAGADDYLQKPFSISILNGKITNLIKSRLRYRNYYSNNNEIEPDKLVSNRMDGEFLRRAISIIEENMSNVNFSTTDLCRELGMSRSNLYLKLTSLTGESGNKFIKKIKFGYACKLLKEGRYNVSEISTIVGFSSPAYFSTSFRKHIGCMPSEYVKGKV